MTVIAWDGRTLAADKRAVAGGGIHRTTTKIERHFDAKLGVALLAITGSWDVAAEMREWWKAGAVATGFPAEARKDEATLIVITADRRIVSFSSGPVPIVIEAKQCAFGSGRDYAEAAMFLGRSAREAVEVACVFQSDCGNGIDTIEMEQ